MSFHCRQRPSGRCPSYPIRALRTTPTVPANRRAQRSLGGTGQTPLPYRIVAAPRCCGAFPAQRKRYRRPVRTRDRRGLGFRRRQGPRPFRFQRSKWQGKGGNGQAAIRGCGPSISLAGCDPRLVPVSGRCTSPKRPVTVVRSAASRDSTHTRADLWPMVQTVRTRSPPP